MAARRSTPVVGRFRGKLLSLETLEITSDVHPHDPLPRYTTAFQDAPKLRNVALTSLPSTLILLPWTQLTDFRGAQLKAKDCLHILQSAISLVNCTFSGVKGNVDNGTLLPPHLGLKVLYLRGGAIACLDLLSILTLPSLVRLEYAAETLENHQRFTSFLSRSPSSQQLSINCAYPCVAHGFPSLLQLTFLDMSGVQTTEMLDFLHKLEAYDPASFLPNLESVISSTLSAIYTDQPLVLVYRNLAGALGSRWRRIDGSSRLKSFQMTCNVAGSAEVLARYLRSPPLHVRKMIPQLVELVEEGMQISVTIKGADITQVWI
ncbi:hypothetical protein C8R47DRAFT_45112 [Mycena vitilis]|nr:hypothetical protein C8R47DRAFT_45112 [Mycena vitilis]